MNKNCDYYSNDINIIIVVILIVVILITFINCSYINSTCPAIS